MPSLLAPTRRARIDARSIYRSSLPTARCRLVSSIEPPPPASFPRNHPDPAVHSHTHARSLLYLFVPPLFVLTHLSSSPHPLSIPSSLSFPRLLMPTSVRSFVGRSLLVLHSLIEPQLQPPHIVSLHVCTWGERMSWPQARSRRGSISASGGDGDARGVESLPSFQYSLHTPRAPSSCCTASFTSTVAEETSDCTHQRSTSSRTGARPPPSPHPRTPTSATPRRTSALRRVVQALHRSHASALRPSP